MEASARCVGERGVTLLQHGALLWGGSDQLTTLTEAVAATVRDLKARPPPRHHPLPLPSLTPTSPFPSHLLSLSIPLPLSTPSTPSTHLSPPQDCLLRRVSPPDAEGVVFSPSKVALAPQDPGALRV